MELSVLKKLYSGCRVLIAFLFCFLSLVNVAHAFESTPEFESLTEEEQSLFEGPAYLGAAYESDRITYQKPQEWEYLWLKNKNAYDMTLGSTGPRHFLIDQRLKFQVQLLDTFEFRFTYFDEGDRERENRHHVLEFVKWLPFASGAKPWIGLSAYGEGFLYKRQNDLGLAILLKPAEHHELRFFNTWVDLVRTNRNDRSDGFVGGAEPRSRGVVGREWKPREDGRSEFTEYALRWETKTRWNFPDSKYEYQYFKELASVYLARPWGEHHEAYLRGEWSRKYEGRFPSTSASAQTRREWTTTRTFVLGELCLRDLDLPGGVARDWEWLPALEIAHRHWDTSEGVTTTRDLLPKLGARIPSFDSQGVRGQWDLSAMSTWHWIHGDWSLLDPSDREGSHLENRFNIGYNFIFRAGAELRLIIGADLDEIKTPRHLWDGGNMQFRANF